MLPPTVVVWTRVQYQFDWRVESRDVQEPFAMVDGPKRKKPAPAAGRSPLRRHKKRQGRASGPLLTPRDLDLQTLVVLSVGDWWDLGDQVWPPEKICRWLDQADLAQLRGLLLATLERWHELRK